MPFRDVRSEQFQYLQLQMAKQGKSESPREFADRCRAVALQTIPHTDDPAAQRIYSEQAERLLLASFTAGLTGTPGLQVRYHMPTTLEEAIQIAITVGQAESQVHTGSAIFLETPLYRSSQASGSKDSAHIHIDKNKSNRGHPKPHK
jgi:hypothetical protein